MKLSSILAWALICMSVIGCSSDNEAPVISITAPDDNDTIRVHTSMITADATDNKDIEYMEFSVENTMVSADNYHRN